MKAAAFDYVRPRDVGEALSALKGNDAKPIAGGQSLGPMLNLRLARPKLLVDVSRIQSLRQIQDEGEAWRIGAAVTHAELEDRALAGCEPLASVARAVAYRAVRNRGTLGGSLAHADPAADWVTTMRVLDAVYVIEGSRGRREIASGDFMQAAFTTVLAADDVLVGVRIAKCSTGTRFGYFKFCRKVGEFAEAIGAVLLDPARGVRRAVIGATAGTPYLVQDIEGVLVASQASIEKEVRAAGCAEPYEFQMHAVALKRAVAQALA